MLVEAGMSSVMPFGSILFGHSADRDEREDLSTFRDLNLIRSSRRRPGETHTT
jgi:hypothetical protein